MRKSLRALAIWCRRPMRCGFAELDLQIEKLRGLRDSYQINIQGQHHDQAIDLKKDGERLCIR